VRLGATYDVLLRLIGKRIEDFLLVLIKLFLQVLAKQIENRHSASGWGGSVSAKFSRRMNLPNKHFCTDKYANECLTFLLRTVFT